MKLRALKITWNEFGLRRINWLRPVSWHSYDKKYQPQNVSYLCVYILLCSIEIFWTDKAYESFWKDYNSKWRISKPPKMINLFI